jgi:hypothetical protein
VITTCRVFVGFKSRKIRAIRAILKNERYVPDLTKTGMIVIMSTIPKKLKMNLSLN